MLYNLQTKCYWNRLIKRSPHFSLPNVKLSITYCGVQLPSLRMYCITVAVTKLLFRSFMQHTSSFWSIKASFLNMYKVSAWEPFWFCFLWLPRLQLQFSWNPSNGSFHLHFRYVVQILVPQGSNFGSFVHFLEDM